MAGLMCPPAGPSVNLGPLCPAATEFPLGRNQMALRSPPWNAQRHCFAPGEGRHQADSGSQQERGEVTHTRPACVTAKQLTTARDWAENCALCLPETCRQGPHRLEA